MCKIVFIEGFLQKPQTQPKKTITLKHDCSARLCAENFNYEILQSKKCLGLFRQFPKFSVLLLTLENQQKINKYYLRKWAQHHIATTLQIINGCSDSSDNLSIPNCWIYPALALGMLCFVCYAFSKNSFKYFYPNIYLFVFCQQILSATIMSQNLQFNSSLASYCSYLKYFLIKWVFNYQNKAVMSVKMMKLR